MATLSLSTLITFTIVQYCLGYTTNANPFIKMENSKLTIKITIPKIEQNSISVGFKGGEMLMYVEIPKLKATVYTKFKWSVQATLSSERVLTITFDPLKEAYHKGTLVCIVRVDPDDVIPGCAGQTIDVQPASSASISLTASPEVMSVNETWTVEGKLYIPDPAKWQEDVYVRIGVKYYTTFRYHIECTSGTPSATSERLHCKCTGVSGNYYTFGCKAKAQLTHSEMMLKACLESSTFGAPELVDSTLGPLVYMVMLKANHVVAPIPLPKGTFVSYPEGAQMEVCVEMAKESTASVRVSSKDGSSGGSCVKLTTDAIARKDISVNLSFGLSRVDRFSFSIKSRVNQTTTTKEDAITSIVTVKQAEVNEGSENDNMDMNDKDNDNENDESLGAGSIAAIVVVTLAVLSALAIGVVSIVKKRRAATIRRNSAAKTKESKTKTVPSAHSLEDFQSPEATDSSDLSSVSYSSLDDDD